MSDKYNYHGLVLEYDNTTGTETSVAIDMFGANGISIHQKQTSGPTGTLTLQEANDGEHSEDTFDWRDTGVSFAALSGTISQVVNVSDVRSRWVSVKYTHTSGTGSGQVWVMVKGNG